MLIGQGNFVYPIRQWQMRHQAYYQQVSNLTCKAPKACNPRYPSAYFCNLIQQSRKLFTDFLTHVNEAGEQEVVLGPIREMFVKQLFWDRLNPATHNALQSSVMRTVTSGYWPQEILNPVAVLLLPSLLPCMSSLRTGSKPTIHSKSLSIWISLGMQQNRPSVVWLPPRTRCNKAFHWVKDFRSQPATAPAHLNSRQGAPQPRQ